MKINQTSASYIFIVLAAYSQQMTTSKATLLEHTVRGPLSTTLGVKVQFCNRYIYRHVRTI